MNYHPMCQDKGCVLYEMLIIVYEFQLISHHPPQCHKNHVEETFHTQYTAYQKHLCHRCDAPTSPPLIRDFSLWICFCGNHFFRVLPCTLYGKNKVIIVLFYECWLHSTKFKQI